MHKLLATSRCTSKGYIYSTTPSIEATSTIYAQVQREQRCNGLGHTAGCKRGAILGRGHTGVLGRNSTRSTPVLIEGDFSGNIGNLYESYGEHLEVVQVKWNHSQGLKT